MDPRPPPADPRTRVRQFLARGTADPAPFLVMATRYTARLAQCDVAELLADPGLFARSYTESAAVLGLEAVLIEVPAAALASGSDASPPGRAVPPPPGRAVLREDLHRLRATLRDQIAIMALLPGPLTLAAARGMAATPDNLDDLVTELIGLQEYLGPAEFDALALLERTSIADPDVPALADATAAFWNVARYYSLPSLLIAAEATPRLATAGPTAVAAWTGTTAADLLAAGAIAAGQSPPALAPQPPALAPPPGPAPSPPGLAPSPPAVTAPLPPGGFYLSHDEIPADWSVDAVRSLVRSAGLRA